MCGRGICPCHHNFCGSFPFSFDFTVEWIVGIAIEPQIPIKPVLGHHDFGDEGFDDRFGYILALVAVSVLLQGILENRELLGVIGGLLVDIYTAKCDAYLHFTAVLNVNVSGESAQSRRNGCSIRAVEVRNFTRNTHLRFALPRGPVYSAH